jgi:integrase
MEKLPKCKPEEYIFKPLDGRLTNHKYLDSSAQTRLWKACKREMNILAGCKLYRNQLVPPFPVAADLTPYCFRHSYATVLHLNKVPMVFRKYLLGHRSIQTTIDVYTHLGLMTADEIADNMAVDDLFKVYD